MGRRGFGDFTGVGARSVIGTVSSLCVGVVGLFCSNILTKDVVGGIGVSSVGLKSVEPSACLIVRIESPPILVLLFNCG